MGSWNNLSKHSHTESHKKSQNDDESRMMVVKRKNGTLNTDGLLSEDIDIYKGRDNSIIMSRVYDIEFLCDFQMQWYLFETCSIYTSFSRSSRVSRTQRTHPIFCQGKLY